MTNNVIISHHKAIAGVVIMADSIKICQYCIINGAIEINGHIEICNKVTVTKMSMAMLPISDPEACYSGILVQPHKV